MEIGFPPTLDRPPVSPSADAVVLHAFLLVLAIGSVWGLFARTRRPAGPIDIVLWPFVILIATVLCNSGASNPIYRPFLTGYLAVVWLVGGAGIVIGIVRLSREGYGIAIAKVLGCLVGLGLLIALLLPTVPQRKDPVRLATCRNNLRQIGLAMHNWHDRDGRFPDSVIEEEDRPPMSWRVALLPFIDHFHLSLLYDEEQPWDDEANLPIAQTNVQTYRCPSVPLPNDRDAQERYYTAYVLVTGSQTIFPNGQGLRLDQITDGTSNTLLAAEACGLNIVWTRPWDFNVERNPVGVNLRGDEPTHSPAMLSSYHDKRGANALMADGGVRFLSENIDRRVLQAITTATGGENVELE